MNRLYPWRSSFYKVMIFGLILLPWPVPGNTATPRYPFPRHVVYAAGSIRPNHVNQIVQDNDVRRYYDNWKKDFLVQDGTATDGSPLYRIAFGKRENCKPTLCKFKVTVSEGQGYGMIIIALMAGYDINAKTEFDGLWNFVRAHPSLIDRRLMAFRVPPTDPAIQDSAFDGDADIAYGLLLAARQWGNCGKINYQAEALKLIGGILESTIGSNSFLPMLGDWVTQSDTPLKYNQWTPRSSDFMLDHFRAFRRASGSPKWDRVVTKVQSVIGQMQRDHSPVTGLLPDFMVPVSATNRTLKPAPPNFLEEGPYTGDYYYNAGRVPWRIGTDALLNNNASSLAYVRKISRWARASTAGNPQNIKGGYHLNGVPLPRSNFFTIFFAAPLGVAAMTDASQQTWLNSLYQAVRNVHEDYYEDSVTLLSLLVMTGNYWNPTTHR